MIEFIKNKANDEKYFGSVKYFYHNLHNLKKQKFITVLARYNVYLAAQCIMTSQKDPIIEGKVIEIAEKNAKDFSNSDKSAKGFLALAEFEKFTLIADLFKDVQKPEKSHTYIFQKIFENNRSQDIFLQLLDVILSINKISLVSHCISTYGGEIHINNENKVIIKKMFDFLFDNKYYGIAKSILEKFDLYKDISLIFNVEPIEFVKKLVYAPSKKLRALKLSYEVYNRFNLIEQFDANLFIEELLRVRSDKSILLAMFISKRQNLRNVELDNILINLLQDKRTNPRVINRNHRKINQFITNGVIEYVTSNKILNAALINFEERFNMKFDFNKKQTGLQTIVFSKNEYSIYEDHIKIPINKPVQIIMDEYFEMRNKPTLEVLVNMLRFHFNKSFMEISHMLRKYLFTGEVVAVFDYGHYVNPNEFNVRNLLFLHIEQYKEQEQKSKVKPNVGESVEFRIIGINQQNFRFNISCLNKFAV